MTTNYSQFMNSYYNPTHGFELFPGFVNTPFRSNENGVLFYSVYLLLKQIRKEFTRQDELEFHNLCCRLEVVPGLFDRVAEESQTVPVELRRSISHDNISAISSISKYHAINIARYGLKHCFIYNNIKPRFRPPMNPGNYSIWLYNGEYKFLFLFFLPFYLINLLITCSKPKEETSSKQLYFVELYPVKDSIIWKPFWMYFRYKMKKMYGKYWLNEIFKIYYQDENHPIRILSEGIEL